MKRKMIVPGNSVFQFYGQIVLPCLAVLLLCGCSDGSGSHDKSEPYFNPMLRLNQNELDLCEAANEFGFNLFQEVAAVEAIANPGENLLVAPVSVSYCLGMILNGASGETQQEMIDALELSDFTIREINEAYLGVMGLLPSVDPAVEVRIANSIWSNVTPTFDPYFANTCRDYFGARVDALDFLNPAGVAEIINRWVDGATKGMITEIFDPADVDGALWLALNALYFKGEWSDKFDRSNTRQDVFYLTDGTAVPCRMMSQETRCGFFFNNLLEGVDLPYGEKAFSMAILVPRGSLTPDDLIAALSPENWNVLLASESSCKVDLQMPRFHFDYEIDLNDTLFALGIEKAFGQSAEFQNMLYPPVPSFIGLVRHKTCFKVDEDGTEAAAATGGAGVIGGPFLKVDRPFVFVIHEDVTGLILFMGKVENPGM